MIISLQKGLQVDDMGKIEDALNYLIKEKYAEPHDLMYSNKLPFNLTPREYDQLKDAKRHELNNGESAFFKLNLKSFNNQSLFYSDKCIELKSLISMYVKAVQDDYKENGSLLILRDMPNILKSRIYSEIEGTLSIESVPTTHKRISEIVSGKRKPADTNDFIIKNMAEAIIFVQKLPPFNKENLFRLYSILSNGCLESDDQLKPGDFYRYDEVEIDRYAGCPHEKIEECMNSLFSFVNETLLGKSSLTKLFLPHIAHYYIAYIHPYFDYNGRTARMVSFWIQMLSESYEAPFASEAIDQTKGKYYAALRNTRDSDNDLTYFLLYLLRITISFYNCYENIEYIEVELKQKGVILTENEKAYIKKILISSKGKFIYSDFTKWIKTDMTKQGAFKILNSLAKNGILLVGEAKSNNKLFEVNKDMLRYKMDLLD